MTWNDCEMISTGAVKWLYSEWLYSEFQIINNDCEMISSGAVQWLCNEIQMNYNDFTQVLHYNE